MPRVLLIDNNDSFTRNLEHLLAAVLGERPEILPSTRLGAVRPELWELLVLSPGPGAPGDYPLYRPLLERCLAAGTRVFGVCLGLQILNEHFGGRTGRLAGCVHGRAEELSWFGRRVRVARYHSLHLAETAPELEVLCRNGEGTVMAAAHRSAPMLGVQFHPESFLTDGGGEVLRDVFRHLDLPGR